MGKVFSVLFVVASLLALVGCSSPPAGKQPSSVMPAKVDLKVGTIQLPPRFSEERTGTKDSRMGTITRDEPRFVITYDIGKMSGLHMHPKKKDTCLSFKETVIADHKCYIGMEKKGTDKVLTISIMPADGAQARNPWTYPANFWATVKTNDDIEDLKQIALSYAPKSEE